MGRARRNDSLCRNLGWTASHHTEDRNCRLGQNYVTAVISPFRHIFIYLILFFFWKFKNGSGEMGAEVDPAVSFGCCGAPSQTRADLNVGWKCYLSLCGTVKLFAAIWGEITGAAVWRRQRKYLSDRRTVWAAVHAEFLRDLTLLKTLDTFQWVIL